MEPHAANPRLDRNGTYRARRDVGLSRIITEVDERGAVTRESGFDQKDNLVHRCPGEPTLSDEYGIFDLARISPSDRNDLDPEEFDRLWALN